MDESFWRVITDQADAVLTEHLASRPDNGAVEHRDVMERIKAAVVCYRNPRSAWYGSAEAIAAAIRWAKMLVQMQGERLVRKRSESRLPARLQLHDQRRGNPVCAAAT